MRYQKELEKYEQVKIQNQPDPVEYAPINVVPEEWRVYLEPLEIIAAFTSKIEGDLQLQQDVYVQVMNTESNLPALADQNNYVAEVLLEHFHERFTSTADLTLSHLAYLFTADGLENFGMIPNDKEKMEKRKKLKKILDIANVLTEKKFTTNTHFISALFDDNVDRFQFDSGEDLFSFWKYSVSEEV